MDIANQIVGAGHRLISEKGYNGFSFADLSKAVGRAKPTIHHHFPSKSDLARSVLDNCAAQFEPVLLDVAQSANEIGGLMQFFGSGQSLMVAEGRMCPLAVLISEYETLPEPLRIDVRNRKTELLDLVARVLLAGQEGGRMKFDNDEQLEARLLLSTINGASALLRPHRNSELYANIVERSLLKYSAC